MNLKNFQNQISPLILQRGKSYFDEGAVSILEEEENGVWTAEVEGSEVYLLEITLEGKDEIKQCFVIVLMRQRFANMS